jgi:hypothetical protein
LIQFSNCILFLLFFLFDTATDNLSNLIGNWERAPITDILLSSTDTCPTDYSLMDTPKWPGTYSDACACKNGAYSPAEGAAQFSSSGSTCDVNQTNAGCINQPTISKVQLDEWRGIHVCLKREGEAQMISSTKTRPIPKKAGKCESGYKACGTSTYDKDRTICFPDSYTCPVTGATAGTSLPDGYNSSLAMSTNDNTWYKRVAFDGEMPINHVELVLYNPGGKRGQCFLGGENQESYSSSASSYTYANDYPSKCSKVDTRWETLDYQSETDYLTENFEDESCTSDSVTADYIATGTQCDPSAPFSSSSCMVNGLSVSFGSALCLSTDEVCKNVVYQSNCGALTRFANEADQYWAVQFRREIYWKSDCDAPMLDVAATEKPIESIEPALATNLAFNVIGNFFIGMFFPICILLNKVYGDVACIPGEGEAEKKLLEWNKKYLNVALSTFKLVPAIVALSFFAKITSTIRRAANGDCADADDARTTQTFKSLDEEISSSISSLWTQVGVDIFNILVAIALTVFAHMKSKRSQVAVSPDEPANEEKALEMVEGGEKDDGSAGSAE